MLRVILFLFLFLGSIHVMSAQSLSSKVVASGGGFTTGSSGSLQFTIGEPSITTYVKSAAILTQGFEQGTLKGSGSSLVSFSIPGLNVTLYPNPASDFVELNVEAPYGSKVDISIYNMLGEKICDVPVINNGSAFQAANSVAGFSDGAYFALVSITNLSTGAIQSVSKSFIIHQ